MANRFSVVCLPYAQNFSPFPLFLIDLETCHCIAVGEHQESVELGGKEILHYRLEFRARKTTRALRLLVSGRQQASVHPSTLKLSL